MGLEQGEGGVRSEGFALLPVRPTLEQAQAAVTHGEQVLRELAEDRKGKLLPGGDKDLLKVLITI